MTLLARIVLLADNLPAQEKVDAPGLLSQFNIQAQTACETETQASQEAFRKSA
jgi:hypothetical protein